MLLFTECHVFVPEFLVIKAHDLILSDQLHHLLVEMGQTDKDLILGVNHASAWRQGGKHIHPVLIKLIVVRHAIEHLGAALSIPNVVKLLIL